MNFYSFHLSDPRDIKRGRNVQCATPRSSSIIIQRSTPLTKPLSRLQEKCNRNNHETRQAKCRRCLERRRAVSRLLRGAGARCHGRTAAAHRASAGGRAGRAVCGTHAWSEVAGGVHGHLLVVCEGAGSVCCGAGDERCQLGL